MRRAVDASRFSAAWAASWAHDYPEDIRTFKTCAYYLPLAGIVASLVVFLLTVKIDENMHDHIVEQLEARLASEETDKQ